MLRSPTGISALSYFSTFPVHSPSLFLSPNPLSAMAEVLLCVHRNRRLIRDGEKGRGGGGMEVGGEGDGDYIPIATLSPQE